MNKVPLIDEKGEVRDLDAEDMAQFKPMSENTGHYVLISGRFVNLFGDFSPLCALALLAPGY